jgi:hypothetical protein
MERHLSVREHHDAWVGAWVARKAKDLRPAERLALFDEAFAALWRRARITLGDLTLSTLVGRTLKEAAAEFPQLARVRTESAGLSFREIREVASIANDPELSEALRFLLVELLAAIGKLTSEALTPLLHRALDRGEPARDVDLTIPGREPLR